MRGATDQAEAETEVKQIESIVSFHKKQFEGGGIKKVTAVTVSSGTYWHCPDADLKYVHKVKEKKTRLMNMRKIHEEIQ